MIKRLVISSMVLSFFFLSLPGSVNAVCPVCTVAIGAGLGLSRYLGVDDLISGIWVGGLILSFSLWLINWLVKKQIKFWGMSWLAVILMYALTLLPLWWGDILGHPFNKIWGIDRLLAGVIAGSVIFMLAVWVDKMVRKTYDRQLFIYQKVVFPVAGLILMSIFAYFFLFK